MKIGIIGLRGVGKSSVFSALTGLNSTSTSSGKTSVQLGHTDVPDVRVGWLSDLFQPKKTTYAGVDFVDIGGLTAEPGQALDAEVLNHLRATDALVQVVQAFHNPASPFRTTPPNPVADLEELHSELVLTDLMVAEKRLERMAKEQTTGTLEYATLVKCKDTLDREKPLHTLILTTEETKAISGFSFLTQKPMLILLNVPEADAAKPVPTVVVERLKSLGGKAMTLAATMEAEIAQLPPDEQAAFLGDLGVTESARARFIRTAYGLLDLVTFFTVGEDEVRAWPVTRGTTAVAAAGTIHSDLARGFIRAEVVPYEKFKTAKSMAAAKKAGTFRLEGKDYIVQDGDILHVRFNV